MSGQNSLFTNSGSLNVVYSKGAAADDASFTLQNNFSTRAIVGLLANDDLTFKVSPDGSNFFDVLVALAADGDVTNLDVRANTFQIRDNTDRTKVAQFVASGITTGTTRSYTLPNANATLAHLGNSSQTFTGTTTVSGTFTASGATTSLGTSTAASTANVGTGATLSGNTKTVNVGTAGVSGSTTNVNIGSAVAGALGTITHNLMAVFNLGLRLLGLTSDPGSPTDGDIWYNSTDARLKARINGRTMTVADDELPYLVPETGRYFTPTSGHGTTTATVAGVADRMNIYPFVPKFDFTCDQLGINVTTAVGSSNAKIVVYDSDLNNRPDGRITETGDLDCSTTGVKTATVSIAFKKGKQYWLGVRTNSTQTISAFQPYTMPNLDMTAIATTQPKTLERTLTYATAAPATWGYVATEAATTNAPAIWLRTA